MLCANLATRRDGFKFPCGQCLNCRINKRRDWQSRLLLEAACHEYGIFVTLTYTDSGTPEPLRKGPLLTFLKSLRKVVPSLRYFAVGEYGTLRGRAHFHAHLFSDTPILDNQLHSLWPFGHIHVGDTEPASLDYVLGYLLKDSKDVRWPIEKSFPEFRVFSQGLGKLALPHLLIDATELPREFKVFGRKWPIGRYLRDRAKKMGFSVSERESVVLEKLEAQAMRSLLADPSLTSLEVEDLYSTMQKRRQLKSQELQKKAIRAAYLQAHGHVKKGNSNETF